MKMLRVPLLLFVLPAILILLAPAWHELLLLDREGLARGELWRLWTGHWVHFSDSHLGWNAAVLLAAGACLESVIPGRLLRYTLLGAPLIGLGLLAGEAELQAYGGLSGLATGIIVLLALTQLGRSLGDRLFWFALLALIAGKTAHEVTQETALFSQFDSAGIRPSAFAHLAGAIVAIGYLVTVNLLNRPGYWWRRIRTSGHSQSLAGG